MWKASIVLSLFIAPFFGVRVTVNSSSPPNRDLDSLDGD
jgi:hypothetical protein